MRLACLQFAPELGNVQGNISRADALLQDATAGHFSVLVLPELAFSGYNYPSLDAIRPFLEPTAAGPSTAWARSTAARLNCVVTVGYPEVASTGHNAGGDANNAAVPASICYNSTITVSPSGDILAHYRKTHLYYTDETWAKESDTKWLTTDLPLAISPSPPERGHHEINKTTRTTFGICMDLNPHQFTAPWTLYELASHTLASESQLLLLSMAWLTHQSTSDLLARPPEPDLGTLSYWVERLDPLVKNEDREIIVVFANRCGEEPPEARYAGSSWIGKVGFGKIEIWDIVGKSQETLLYIDTDQQPQYSLQTSKNSP